MTIKGKTFIKVIKPSYFRGASAAIITFDKSDKDTFKVAKDYYQEFRKHIPELSVPVAVVGFITDSEEITAAKGQSWAVSWELHIMRLNQLQGEKLLKLFFMIWY